MAFQKGDRVKGKYLGLYPFKGTVFHADVRNEGQGLYIDCDATMIYETVAGVRHERNTIYVESADPVNEVKKVLDNRQK